MKLNKIAWTFTKQRYTEIDKFDREVSRYQKDACGNDGSWFPDEIVFDAPELQIQYMAWVKGASDLLENEVLIDEDQDVFQEQPDEELYQVEIIATLKAHNEENFTAAEFLMKAHNQQANKELGDHVFFEGADENPVTVGGLPTFFIACGS